MNIKLRPGTRKDAAECGLILFEAFKSVANQHNFPWDYPSVEIAIGVVTMMLSNPGFYSVIAEMDGRVVGSNFLDVRNPIAGIGPITVDPAVQNQTVGRQLMRLVMERAAQLKFAGVRLVQAAYHNRSLCLYTKLGFATRETLRRWTVRRSRSEFPATMCDRQPSPTCRRATAFAFACMAMIAAASFATR